MRNLFAITLLILLTGCTTGQVWVISQRPEGGVVGYHGYLTGPSAKEAVVSKIACRPYELGEDVEKTKEGASEKDAKSKLPSSDIDDWHEVSYTCAK